MKIIYLVTLFTMVILLSSGCIEDSDKISTVDKISPIDRAPIVDRYIADKNRTTDKNPVIDNSKQAAIKTAAEPFDGQDISGAKQVIAAAANVLAAGDIPAFNSYLSSSIEDFDSLSQDRANALALAFKSAKMVKVVGIGIISWEMTLDGEKFPFTTIMEEGKWKIL